MRIAAQRVLLLHRDGSACGGEQEVTCAECVPTARGLWLGSQDQSEVNIQLGAASHSLRASRICYE